MPTHSDHSKPKAHQPNPAHAKGFDPKQPQNSKHPGYDPAHPQGNNPKVVRSKIALQHTHRHGRGEG